MKFVAACLLASAACPGVSAFAFHSTPSSNVAASTEVSMKRASLKPSFQLNAETVDSDTVAGLPDTIETEYELLGLPARPGRPLKVAIAGGGVGGLTAAYYMLKKGFDVTVYEKTSEFARFGGPIQTDFDLTGRSV
ncbi:unnamed protein product [Pseudo-nitzschia multistriata]|uniref:Rhodanese domain-containing protein n=1 Tax=Pseudo-nitzschia multistriata TaxID=183589 RepID=A0A448ZMD6_9STRA|nr:unnamed protein product [Pseudo-nitzschia multistriata]